MRISILNDLLELSTNLDNPVYDSNIFGRRGGPWLGGQETLANPLRTDTQNNQATPEIPEEVGNSGIRENMTAVAPPETGTLTGKTALPPAGHRKRGQIGANHLSGVNRHRHSSRVFRRGGQSFSSAL